MNEDIKNLHHLCDLENTSTKMADVRYYWIVMNKGNVNPHELVDPETGELRSKEFVCNLITNMIRYDIRRNKRHKRHARINRNLQLVGALVEASQGHSRSANRDLNMAIRSDMIQRHQRPRFLRRIQYARQNVQYVYKTWKNKQNPPVRTYDKYADVLCSKHNNIYNFRKHLLNNPRRFFKGKHLQIRHLFRPDGTPRNSIAEICWAFKCIGWRRFWGIFGD
jgi:hypothetical protein